MSRGQASQLDVTEFSLTTRFLRTSFEIVEGSFPNLAAIAEKVFSCSIPIWEPLKTPVEHLERQIYL